jgi:formylglycine-generating enzyme required for sulfatase activity
MEKGNDITILGIRQRFCWIPPGEFLMGSPECEEGRYSDESQHEVEITSGFWLADTVCTQELWEAVMGINPSFFKGEELPVENVSWGDCQDFINKINNIEPGLNFRLPSEAEWEYACRAGTISPFYFGENITTEQANYCGNYPYSGGKEGEYRGETVTVKSLPPNGWGIYGMHGNVWEWCEDRYGEYPTGRVVDPQGPEEGDDRVLRGGSWISNGRWCRSAYRDGYHPGTRNDYIGFRLAMD